MSEQRTYEWIGQTHAIRRPDIPDEEVARQVRMLSPSDLNHEMVCLLGRDRIMALSKELTAAQARAAGYVEHIKSLEAEVERLNAIKFKRFNNDDCWIYQGDGDDHLESLVCPVVVSPHKMIELEAAQARVAELEASNERLRTHLLGLFCIRIPEKDGDGFTIDISNEQADRIEEVIKTS